MAKCIKIREISYLAEFQDLFPSLPLFRSLPPAACGPSIFLLGDILPPHPGGGTRRSSSSWDMLRAEEAAEGIEEIPSNLGVGHTGERGGPLDSPEC